MYAVQMQMQGVLPVLHGANALGQHGTAIVLGIFRLRAPPHDCNQRHRCAALKMTDAKSFDNHVISTSYAFAGTIS